MPEIASSLLPAGIGLWCSPQDSSSKKHLARNPGKEGLSISSRSQCR
ncbi:MAG: hypothetical protein ACP5PV_07370 [Methanothrix sp.]